MEDAKASLSAKGLMAVAEGEICSVIYLVGVGSVRWWHAETVVGETPGRLDRELRNDRAERRPQRSLARRPRTQLAAELAEALEHGLPDRRELLGQKLNFEEWMQLMANATRRKCVQGETVLNEGDNTRALYQLVRGTLRAQVTARPRPNHP